MKSIFDKHETLDSPLIIVSVTMSGFLTSGETREEAIYGRIDCQDYTGRRIHWQCPGYVSQA